METLDEIDYQELNKTPNSILNVMSILGYIANGFWLLMCIIIVAMGETILPEIFPDEDLSSGEFLLGLYIGFSVIAIMCATAIVGLVLAHKKRKSGVIIYGIANGFWVLINLISLQPTNLIIAVISISFIAVIAMNYNK
jgi:hypothetical protein